jgi:hypothetical protein
MRCATKGLDVILDEEEYQEQDGDHSHDTNDFTKEVIRAQRNGSICFFRNDGIIEDAFESMS